VYRFILFNQAPKRLSNRPAVHGRRRLGVTDAGIHHALLGFDQSMIERIAVTIEKVMNDIDALRRYQDSQHDDGQNTATRSVPANGPHSPVLKRKGRGSHGRPDPRRLSLEYRSRSDDRRRLLSPTGK